MSDQPREVEGHAYFGKGALRPGYCGKCPAAGWHTIPGVAVYPACLACEPKVQIDPDKGPPDWCPRVESKQEETTK